MDFAKGADFIAVRHVVADSGLQLQHHFDVSPAVVRVVQEIKICVISLAAIWSVTTLCRSWLASNKDYTRK